MTLVSLSNVITIYDCGYFTNCSGCQQASLGCGWCLTQSKCLSLASVCDISDPSGYFTTGACPSFTSVTPNYIPVGISTQLTLDVSNVPDLTNSPYGK